MNDILRSLKKLASSTHGVVLTIDEEKQYMEIDGHPKLKKIIFEIASYVIKRWNELDTVHDVVHYKPEGAKWYLPFLPPGGIDVMSAAIIEIYWVEIMHVVVGHRVLGYQTMR